MNRRKRIHGHRRVKRAPFKSLSGKSDGNLIGVATYAAMQKVPKPLDKTFDKLAKSYQKRTETVAEAIKPIAKSVGEGAGKITKALV